MAVQYKCKCGSNFDLRDEFAGKLVECPWCGATGQAPAVGAALTPTSQADPIFDRDLFLLNQKHLAINEKYMVLDEQGQPLAFVERPAFLGRQLLMLLATITAAAVVGVGGVMASEALVPQEYQPIVTAAAVILALFAAVATMASLAPKRHVTFFRDESKRDRILVVEQDQRLQWLEATFTVRDGRGKPIARFYKNYLRDIFRKRWDVEDVRGKKICVAKEDSIILSLIRRLFPQLGAFFRTNFVFMRPSDEKSYGEFQRKLTILDKYALDLREDRNRELDRRIALALGVMLDTGERR
ncbi:MAG TPA: hypothetical protein VHM67_00410 [Gemmatimonadaceae bacterium]|nr:hypothetical protein [Gemmatimonadaceae bacterium]